MVCRESCGSAWTERARKRSRRFAPIWNWGTNGAFGRLDKSRTQIGKWSAAFKWVERAAAYDAEQWRAEREREKRDARKMRKRQLEAAEAYQQKAMDAFNLLEPSDLKPGEILRFYMEAAKLERELRRDADAGAERKAETDSASEGFSEAMIQAHKRRTEGEA